MTIAVIIGGKVDNLIECDSVELAASLLPGAVCVDGAELNIGEAYPPGSDPEVTTEDALHEITEALNAAE